MMMHNLDLELARARELIATTQAQIEGSREVLKAAELQQAQIEQTIGTTPFLKKRRSEQA